VPELPEVEYTRRRLQRAMAGARIDRVVLRRANLRHPFQPDLARRLAGQQVTAVARRAKYLLVELASGDVLLMHLGMSGSLRVVRSGGEPLSPQSHHDARGLEPHDHVVFEMSSGRVVVFNDPRRFGFVTLLAPGERDMHVTLATLGPEPLARRFDAAALARALSGRRTSLKAALSDQRVIAGLGNIYVVEALHRAGLSPRRLASTLVTTSGEPRPALHALVDAIRHVLRTAIRQQYRTGADDPFEVYDRAGEPCPRTGCRGTIRRIVQAGRSTFFCPACQR
jgi:formamidopyrimidine-DNA glycosylase